MGKSTTNPKEVPTLFTDFLGVNVSVSPATLPAEVMQRAQNWVPSPAYTLIHRLGIAATGNDIAVATDAPASLRVSYQGHHYLYVVTNLLGGAVNDQIAVSLDDGPFTAVPNGIFDATGVTTYDLVQYGSDVYCSNGQSLMKRIPIGGTAVDLVPLDTFVDTATDPAIVADPGSTLLTGTYSFCWGVYDEATSLWVRRSGPRTVTINETNDQAITFTAPSASYLLPAGTTRFHLFLAPVLLPIEYAHDQTPDGVVGNGSVTIRAVSVEQTPVPMPGFITRRGRYLIAHRGRVFAAHDSTTADGPRRVYATNVLLPGYEQEIFNQGTFFPANAVISLPVGPITALGIVSLTGTQRSPTSPLAIFTATQTWIFLGDILDDPGAELIQRSDRVGSVSHHATVTTPYGLIFPSIDSFQLLMPDGNITDVGWPIRKVLERVIPRLRDRMVAVYHDGFYKVAIPANRSNTNSEMWWLDLRRGLGRFPSWWGPHTFGSPDAEPATWCVGSDEGTRKERLFGMSMNGIGTEHDIGLLDLGEPAPASLLTGLVNLGQPFQRKLATRVRVVALPGDDTTLAIHVIVDEATTHDFGDITLTVNGGRWWHLGVGDNWFESNEPTLLVWSTSVLREGTALAESDRPRGQAFAVQIDHAGRQTIELRRGELSLNLVPRTMQEDYS